MRNKRHTRIKYRKGISKRTYKISRGGIRL